MAFEVDDGEKLTICEMIPKHTLVIQFGELKVSFYLTPEMGRPSLFAPKRTGLNTTVKVFAKGFTLDNADRAGIKLRLGAPKGAFDSVKEKV